jgi:hypothetical protein
MWLAKGPCNPESTKNLILKVNSLQLQLSAYLPSTSASGSFPPHLLHSWSCIPVLCRCSKRACQSQQSRCGYRKKLPSFRAEEALVLGESEDFSMFLHSAKPASALLQRSLVTHHVNIEQHERFSSVPQIKEVPSTCTASQNNENGNISGINDCLSSSGCSPCGAHKNGG